MTVSPALAKLTVCDMICADTPANSMRCRPAANVQRPDVLDERQIRVVDRERQALVGGAPAPSAELAGAIEAKPTIIQA